MTSSLIDIVVIGSGGREHSFALKLSESDLVKNIYVLPGRKSMSDKKVIAHPDLVSEKDWVKFCQKNKIQYAVIGPEVPLINGLVDSLNEIGVKALGPSAYCAQLEGSKLFAKDFMRKANIPTAKFEKVTSLEKGLKLIKKWPDINQDGLVIKANGPAGGKGVYLSTDKNSSLETFKAVWEKKMAGAGGHEEIFFEQKLVGQEISVFYLCRNTAQGPESFYLGSAFDHKRLYDKDLGPNTGGMGCVSSNVFIHKNGLREKIEQKVLWPTLNQMQRDSHPYEGILFLGLMIVNNEPFVIEYNCRFGDPEAQTLIPLWSFDFAQVLIDFLEKKPMDKLDISSDYSTHIVLCSKNYGLERPMLTECPILYEDLEYDSLKLQEKFYEDFQAENVHLTYSGTELDNERLVNVSGRVLGVSGVDKKLAHSIEKSYKALEKLSFTGSQHRMDIGHKAISLEGRPNEL